MSVENYCNWLVCVGTRETLQLCIYIPLRIPVSKCKGVQILEDYIALIRVSAKRVIPYHFNL